MSGAACKAAICDKKAQGLMNAGVETIEAFKVEDPNFRVQSSEIYIKHMEAATKEVMQLNDTWPRTKSSKGKNSFQNPKKVK